MVYSVPRRYDLTTLFAVTLAYAVLFAALRLLSAPPAVMLSIGGFVALVGLGQALLFKGSAPRAASMVVGFIVCGAAPIVYVLSDPRLRRGDIEEIVAAAPCWAVAGTMLGYLTGAAVAGVFLVADAIRRRLRRLKRDSK